MALVQATLMGKPQKSGGGGLGSILGSIGGAIGGGILGIAGGPMGVIGGASAGSALGGKLGGVTGSIIKKGDDGYSAQQPIMTQSNLASSQASQQLNPKTNNVVLEDALAALNDPSTPDEIRDAAAPNLINAYILNATQLNKMNQGVA